MSSTSSWQMRKVSRPTWRTATPSAKRFTWGSVTRRPGGERCLHRVRIHGLDADDLRGRHHPFHVRGNAGDEPAAADGHEDRVDGPRVLAHDLHPDGALPAMTSGSS
jgi:hypothetical protein